MAKSSFQHFYKQDSSTLYYCDFFGGEVVELVD